MDVTVGDSNFKKPAGFIEMQLENPDAGPDDVLKRLDSDSVELWLIQAPNDLDFKDLEGMKVILSEEPAKFKLEESGRTVEMFAKLNDPLHTYLPGNSPLVLKVDHATNNLKPVKKSFRGHLNIVDSVSFPEFSIPKVSATKKAIPEGLRQRFVPFGSVFDGFKQEDDVTSKSHNKSRSKSRQKDDHESYHVSFQSANEDETSVKTETGSHRKGKKSTRSKSKKGIKKKRKKDEDDVEEAATRKNRKKTKKK